MLVDLQLSDLRLDFLGLAGERWRVLTCQFCTCYTPVFTEVDLNGGVRWSALNRRPDWLPVGGAVADLIQVRLGLGGERRTPFEAMAFGNHMSQLGGLPSWIQNPDYPACPRCGRLMLFLGQVDSGNEFPGWEGMLYAFLDPDCGIAATCYQQT